MESSTNDHSYGLSYTTLIATLAVCLAFSKMLGAWMTMYELSKIPTIGPAGFLSSWFAGVKFVKNARALIQEGYDKFHGRPFKIRMPDQWIVVATGTDLLNDIRKAGDDELSFDEATDDLIQARYTVGPELLKSRYHLNVVRGSLTRSIQSTFAEVRDEIQEAFQDEVPLSKEWTSVPAYDTIMRIVCRTTNRLFVGLPLCREPDWIDLNIQFTIDVFKSAAIINLFPEILKPIIGNLLAPIRRSRARAMKHLKPIIEDRLERIQQGEEVMQNDVLTWLLDPSVNPGGEFRSVKDLTMRILNLNMAAIHTTSMAFTNTIFYLCVQPSSVVAELRKEIEDVIDEYGWSKLAMGQMRKLDSFMKETVRMVGFGATNIDRKTLKPFTFSDGTTLPTGTRIVVPQWAWHHDERHFTKPDTFEPFRFSDMRSNNANGSNFESFKHQMATPDEDYIFFGTGRHACPGRFFAVNELKTLCAHVLLNYDICLEEKHKRDPGSVNADPNVGNGLPEPVWFASSMTPNPAARVLFRRRKD
ncbi:hypothetical protein D9758_016776 [Tetrapyrgos nigripes]|uniref:Cytochrome P450 n=1 Tax=Tetrapyrgos nigripes TaxID=182062 RepID=A0A8H5BR18_9AGAR|nr:hypothetical protein D9758_016776 [Tetrapyrgos nigripes]